MTRQAEQLAVANIFDLVSHPTAGIGFAKWDACVYVLIEIDRPDETLGFCCCELPSSDGLRPKPHLIWVGGFKGSAYDIDSGTVVKMV